MDLYNFKASLVYIETPSQKRDLGDEMAQGVKRVFATKPVDSSLIPPLSFTSACAHTWAWALLLSTYKETDVL